MRKKFLSIFISTVMIFATVSCSFAQDSQFLDNNLGYKANTTNLSTITSNDNTTSSNALYVKVDSDVKGQIKQKYNVHWYKTSLDEQKKLTISLKTDATADFRLMMYRYNEDTSQLEYIDAASETKTQKSLTKILDKGQYYFAILAVNGFGKYDFYIGSPDKNSGIDDDDTVASANILPNEHLMTVAQGTIDTADDVDIYKFTTNAREFSKVELISPKGQNYKIAYSEDGVKFSTMPIVKWFKKESTYYLKVYTDGDYDNTQKYTLNKYMLENAKLQTKFINSTPDYKYDSY